MSKIGISFIIDVEIDSTEKFLKTWEGALEGVQEGIDIIKAAVQKDNRISNVQYKGIHEIYKTNTQ